MKKLNDLRMPFMLTSQCPESLSEVKRQTDRAPHKTTAQAMRAQTYSWLCCDNIFSRQTMCWSCGTRVRLQMMVLFVSSLSLCLVIFISNWQTPVFPHRFWTFVLGLLKSVVAGHLFKTIKRKSALQSTLFPFHSLFKQVKTQWD